LPALELALIDYAELILVIVQIQLHEIIRDRSLTMRLESGKVGKFLPVAEIEMKLEPGQLRAGREDLEPALHDHGMARHGAGERIDTGRLGRLEDELFFFARIQHFRVHPDLRILREIVPLERFFRLFHLPIADGHGIGARLEEDHVVRHLVLVLEGQLYIRAGLKGELGHVVTHLAGERLDGEALGLGQGGPSEEKGKEPEERAHAVIAQESGLRREAWVHVFLYVNETR
jgi:hypothetical protein